MNQQANYAKMSIIRFKIKSGRRRLATYRARREKVPFLYKNLGGKGLFKNQSFFNNTDTKRSIPSLIFSGVEWL